MHRRGLLRAAAATAVVAACGSTSATATPTKSLTTAPPGLPASKATVELAKGGSFVFTLRADKAPKTVANFAKKSRAGDYDGTTFHRVVPGFVAQGGDPLSKTLPAGDARLGTGGGQQATELSDLPFVTGAVGAARGGDIRVSNDAQFYVCLGDAPHLNGQYTNFGQVTSGMDVVGAIKIGDKIKSIKID
ncbi:MAG: peptidylprolyl isomerase [Candidatus Limnocylindria bacterium]